MLCSHGRGLEGERPLVTNGTTSREVASRRATRPHGAKRVARGCASAKEKELSWRRRARRRASAVEHTGDGVGGVDDLDDAHATAAPATYRHVDGEHAGEEAGPADAARGLGRGQAVQLGGAWAGEVERYLLAGELGVAAGDDARAQVMVAGEDTEVADHVETWRRNEGAQAGQKLVFVHVGVGDAAAPRGLEVDADAAIGERYRPRADE